MALNQKMTGRAMSVPAGVLMGAGCSVLWTVAGAALLAMLIHREALQERSIGYGSMVILLTAAWLGSQIAWGKVKHRRGLVCLSVGGVYFLMLLGMTALFFGGQYEAVGVTAVLVLSGSGLCILQGMGKPAGRGYGRRKKHG